MLGEDGDLLVAAAALHDIGYAPDLARTGFHPLDGARFLGEQGASERLCALVAHHSCAIREAQLRGLAEQMESFEDEASPTRDALWYCDMVTGPAGERVPISDRLAEIRQRYGPASLVGRFVSAASPELHGAAERTLGLMAAAGVDQPRYG